MKLIAWTGALLFLLPSAHAEMFKCKTSDGKIEYSDRPCEYQAKPVNLGDSSFGGVSQPNKNDPTARAPRSIESEQAASRASAPSTNPKGKSSPPTVCKFASYAFGDDKGKSLANNAKAECERNNELKAAGRGDEISLEHYGYWKDHHDAMTTRRGSQRTTNCAPDGFGGFRCN